MLPGCIVKRTSTNVAGNLRKYSKVAISRIKRNFKQKCAYYYKNIDYFINELEKIQSNLRCMMQMQKSINHSSIKKTRINPNLFDSTHGIFKIKLSKNNALVKINKQPSLKMYCRNRKKRNLYHGRLSKTLWVKYISPEILDFRNNIKKLSELLRNKSAKNCFPTAVNQSRNSIVIPNDVSSDINNDIPNFNCSLKVYPNGVVSIIVYGEDNFVTVVFNQSGRINVKTNFNGRTLTTLVNYNSLGYVTVTTKILNSRISNSKVLTLCHETHSYEPYLCTLNGATKNMPKLESSTLKELNLIHLYLLENVEYELEKKLHIYNTLLTSACIDANVKLVVRDTLNKLHLGITKALKEANQNVFNVLNNANKNIKLILALINEENKAKKEEMCSILCASFNNSVSCLATDPKQTIEEIGINLNNATNKTYTAMETTKSINSNESFQVDLFEDQKCFASSTEKNKIIIKCPYDDEEITESSVQQNISVDQENELPTAIIFLNQASDTYQKSTASANQTHIINIKKSNKYKGPVCISSKLRYFKKTKSNLAKRIYKMALKPNKIDKSSTISSNSLLNVDQSLISLKRDHKVTKEVDYTYNKPNTDLEVFYDVPKSNTNFGNNTDDNSRLLTLLSKTETTLVEHLKPIEESIARLENTIKLLNVENRFKKIGNRYAVSYRKTKFKKKQDYLKFYKMLINYTKMSESFESQKIEKEIQKNYCSQRNYNEHLEQMLLIEKNEIVHYSDSNCFKCKSQIGINSQKHSSESCCSNLKENYKEIEKPENKVSHLILQSQKSPTSDYNHLEEILLIENEIDHYSDCDCFNCISKMRTNINPTNCYNGPKENNKINKNSENNISTLTVVQSFTTLKNDSRYLEEMLSTEENQTARYSDCNCYNRISNTRTNIQKQNYSVVSQAAEDQMDDLLSCVENKRRRNIKTNAAAQKVLSFTLVSNKINNYLNNGRNKKLTAKNERLNYYNSKVRDKVKNKAKLNSRSIHSGQFRTIPSSNTSTKFNKKHNPCSVISNSLISSLISLSFPYKQNYTKHSKNKTEFPKQLEINLPISRQSDFKTLQNRNVTSPKSAVTEGRAVTKLRSNIKETQSKLKRQHFQENRRTIHKVFPMNNKTKRYSSEADSESANEDIVCLYSKKRTLNRTKAKYRKQFVKINTSSSDICEISSHNKIELRKNIKNLALPQKLFYTKSITNNTDTSSNEFAGTKPHKMLITLAISGKIHSAPNSTYGHETPLVQKGCKLIEKTIL